MLAKKIGLLSAILLVGLGAGAASAQTAAKPTDAQIAHIAYTAGEIDIEAAQAGAAKIAQRPGARFRRTTWSATTRRSTTRRWRW